MRARLARGAVGVLGALLLGGCWADFPDNLVDDDAYVPSDTIPADMFQFMDKYLPPADLALDAGPDLQLDAKPDQQPKPDTATDAEGDAATDTIVDGPKDASGDAPVDAKTDAVLDQKVSDTFSCTPNTFIKCLTKTTLQRCNSKGDGTLTTTCTPFDCNATAGRCNNCAPGSSPTCSGSNLVTCSAAGLEQITACALGCKAGACCLNVDKDSHTDCAGDCNDNDPLVFPGQTAWQVKASNGSFDYNCDKNEELQYPGLVSCKMASGACVGDGWTGTIPKCGVQGSLTVCKQQGSSCVASSPIFASQGCR